MRMVLNLRILAWVVVSCTAILVLVGSFTPDLVVSPQPADTTPSLAGPLIEQHQCFTGPTPAGVIPGHVVYDGRYLGVRATGQAIDAVMGRPSPLDPNRVQAFCR